ncbi:hypothetical protein BHE74_00050002, partial [Ensete ventricosum]
ALVPLWDGCTHRTDGLRKGTGREEDERWYGEDEAGLGLVGSEIRRSSGHGRSVDHNPPADWPLRAMDGGCGARHVSLRLSLHHSIIPLPLSISDVVESIACCNAPNIAREGCLFGSIPCLLSRCTREIASWYRLFLIPIAHLVNWLLES